MTEFFREVDEDLRRDRVLRYWTKYRYLLIVFAVLVVAATGGSRFYGHYREEAAQAAGTKYEAAAQLSRDGKPAEAAAAFDALSKTAPKGYAVLARLRAAG
ncbi:MAG: tetratricopeptide repeat protein, partial [Methylocella sp.]